MSVPRASRASLVGPLLVLLVVASLASCSTRMGLDSIPVSPSPSAAASGAVVASASASTSPPSSPGASPSIPASPVTGIVTKVDSAGLGSVSGFTLRTDAGQTLVLSIGTLENGAQFPPGHLAEHLATAVPVKVWFRDEGGRLVAYRIEDAG